KASAKRPVKKAAAKRPAKKVASKSGKKAVKKTAKRAVKKSAKRPIKKAAAKKPATKKVAAKKSTSAKVDAAKIVIPPVPSRSTASVTSTPAPAKPSAPAAPAKKSSSSVLFLVIAGVVLLAIFALTNSSDDEGATPTPTASESVSEEPSAEPSESASEEPALSAYEAPQGFVAIANGSEGVTLRWKAPTATEGLTGYVISVSYNAVDFTEVTTVAVDQLSYEIAKVGDEGGTQFLLQSVYSDGTKVDAKKFSLKGKFQ
ncbi:MAG: hypothetical protein RLZZ291_485, partial [Actinomycetota bacterium]